MTSSIYRSSKVSIHLRYQNMPTKSILIINPNSTSSMTDGLKPLVDALNFNDTTHDYFTAPSGPKSINDEDDAAESAKHCAPHLKPLLHKYDGFLVACYSQHPLVPWLKDQLQSSSSSSSTSTIGVTTGIFEASVATSLQLIGPTQKFGIVSTGKVWEEILSDATAAMLGTSSSSSSSATTRESADNNTTNNNTNEISKRFAGVETTGLNATELHDAPAAEVRRKMKDATKRLLRKGDVGAVCLGCAGMSGMNEMVREAAVEELGEVEGRRVRIVDGVQAGVAWLEGAIRTEF